nr:hypothetical protein [Tanacetum cinerariifolium]
MNGASSSSTFPEELADMIQEEKVCKNIHGAVLQQPFTPDMKHSDWRCEQKYQVMKNPKKLMNNVRDPKVVNKINTCHNKMEGIKGVTEWMCDLTSAKACLSSESLFKMGIEGMRFRPTVKMVDDCIGPEVEKLVAGISNRDVLLLENVRVFVSTEGVTKYLKPSVAGYLMQKAALLIYE